MKTARNFVILALFFAFAPAIFAQNFAAESPENTNRWQLIVIHHSASAAGSAETFDAWHRRRGMRNGLAYHFVIGNGTEGVADGEIQTGERWIRQIAGGHCRQQHINEHGVGICLVGDFSRAQPTPKQLESLLLLVRGLQEQFQIPPENVVGHGELFGEFSECPGKNFPWPQLRAVLNGTNSHMAAAQP
jgi:N-acetylmuramoyl-L-alanine amidase